MQIADRRKSTFARYLILVILCDGNFYTLSQVTCARTLQDTNPRKLKLRAGKWLTHRHRASQWVTEADTGISSLPIQIYNTMWTSLWAATVEKKEKRVYHFWTLTSRANTSSKFQPDCASKWRPASFKAWVNPWYNTYLANIRPRFHLQHCK